MLFPERNLVPGARLARLRKPAKDFRLAYRTNFRIYTELNSSIKYTNVKVITLIRCINRLTSELVTILSC
jgi:hypothetical protein